MKAGSKPKSYRYEDKWSYELGLFKFTQIPNVLLECQGHLKLNDGELLTLIHLITYWFSNTSEVFPSITTLRKFSHKSYPTIQKRLRRLEEKGFIQRVHRFGTSNVYDLTKSIPRLENHLKVCPYEHRKQSEYYLVHYQSPPSITTNKEYEAKETKRNKTENVKVKAQNASSYYDFSQYQLGPQAKSILQHTINSENQNND